jgi:hypothetical protein
MESRLETAFGKMWSAELMLVQGFLRIMIVANTISDEF